MNVEEISRTFGFRVQGRRVGLERKLPEIPIKLLGRVLILLPNMLRRTRENFVPLENFMQRMKSLGVVCVIGQNRAKRVVMPPNASSWAFGHTVIYLYRSGYDKFDRFDFIKLINEDSILLDAFNEVTASF